MKNHCRHHKLKVDVSYIPLIQIQNSPLPNETKMTRVEKEKMRKNPKFVIRKQTRKKKKSYNFPSTLCEFSFRLLDAIKFKIQ